MKLARASIVLVLGVVACTVAPTTAPVPARPGSNFSVIPLPASIQLDTSSVFRVDTSTTIYVTEMADSSTFGLVVTTT